MSRARFDPNNIPSLIGVSNVDGSTPIELWVDPGSHALIIQGTSGGALATKPAIANAAAPTNTDGNQVALSQDLAGNTRVLPTGFVADGVTAAGNPLRVAGVANSADRSYSNGQMATFRFAQTGELYVRARNSNADFDSVRASSDGLSQNLNAYAAVGQNTLYNGTTIGTWDRQRNNITQVLISAGATTTQTVTLTTYNARALTLVVNVSAYTSGTINLALNGVSASAYVYSLLTSITGLAATGVNVYRVGLGFTPSAGLVANDALPRTVQLVISGTFVATYGVDYLLGV